MPKGPFIDTGWKTLQESLSVEGSGQCIGLVQRKGGSGAPPTGTWIAGKRVLDAKPGEIAPGTVIATFWCGHYPSHSSGNHAALYVSHAQPTEKAAGWIEVVEQWTAVTYVPKDGGGKQRVATPYAPKAARAERGGKGHIRGQPKLFVQPKQQDGVCTPNEMPRMSNVAEYYHVVMAED